MNPSPDTATPGEDHVAGLRGAPWASPAAIPSLPRDHGCEQGAVSQLGVSARGEPDASAVTGGAVPA